MAHNIQSMMYFGEAPWHKLGKELDNPATAKEAIEAAELNWEVEKQVLYADKKGRLRVPYRFAMVRKDLYEKKVADSSNQTQCPIFGIVSKGYMPLQNKTAFSFFDSIVGKNAPIYHTAGALGQGERIWILAKLPGHIIVVGDDITDKYLLLSNAHDGESSVQIKFTPIRVVCQNTLTMALSYGQSIRVAHYKSLFKNLEKAKQMLGIIQSNYESIENSFKAMAKVQLSKKTLHQYYNNVIPLPTILDSDIKERQYKWVKKQHWAFEELFESGRGSDIRGVQGTLWAAYNSIVEFTDYKKTLKSPNKRLKSIWFGHGASIKVKAFRIADSWEEVSKAA